MNKILFIVIYLFAFQNAISQALAAHAGTDITQGDSLSITQLSGSATGGTAPYAYAWRLLTTPNGNAWCGNILNPTNAATEVLYTGPFSSPFKTAYSYELKVTDNVAATAKDTIVVNVTYSTPSPPQATGSGFHYVTSADSIADIYHQMSPSRKDIWINGANTDNYNSNTSIDLRNVFAVHPDSRVFISAGAYYNITLQIAKDSALATPGHPWYLVPYGGQVSWFDPFTIKGTWKYFVITGQYNTQLAIGNVNFQGHAKNYAFSSGTYGFFENNNWKNIDAQMLDFSGCDTLHDGELSYIEGPNGGAYFALFGNLSQTVPIYNMKIHDNYIRDSQAEAWYIMRTQSDPQQEADSFQIYNNRITRSGLEIDQFGQNGQNNHEYNNVFWLSATNWISPFDINQAFGNQRFYRKNGNILEGAIYVGAAEQVLSLIDNKPTAVTLTTDTNYVRKTVVFNGKGAKDAFLGSQNTGTFHHVFDSLYLGNRPHIYIANRVYNGASNNSTSQLYSILTQQNFSPNITIAFRHIRYDSSGGKNRLDAAVASTTYSDTTRVNSLNSLKFIQTGWADNSTFPNLFSRWVDTIYNTFKNENAGVTGVNQNQPYTFNVGDYVQHCGKIYFCLQQNQGHPPIGTTDSFWQLQTWKKPDGTITNVPPDDLRLPANDFYALQGIGLIDQYLGTWIVVPSGAKVLAH